MPFELGKSEYVSETISNIKACLTGMASHLRKQIFLFVNKSKFDALGSYFLELYDDAVKHDYDQSLYVAIHTMLKEYNIPHLIMDHNNQFLNNKVKEFVSVNWGDLSQDYPDKLGSGHCDELGNKIMGEKVIKHITEHNLL